MIQSTAVLRNSYLNCVHSRSACSQFSPKFSPRTRLVQIGLAMSKQTPFLGWTEDHRSMNNKGAPIDLGWGRERGS